MKLFALTALALAAVSHGAAPAIDDPVPAEPLPLRVTPKVPVGKTLLFPITASDADGDILSYKVTSSNPKILVRAKTGNPTLRLSVTHAAGGANDPAFSGTMEFMLFRDWLPITTGYVAGFAQSGFYNNTIFHRITDLGGGIGTTGFIFQGGDPLGTGGGGPGMTANDSQTAWKFQNEFHTATIFTGRGQLAMANAGTTTGYSLGANGTLLVPDYLDTNGSQFFITDGQPRHLDFKHNIFAQMLRGWELLPQMRAMETSSSRPVKDLKITSAGIFENRTDAVLAISAKGLGTSKITITTTDSTGDKATKSFIVEAVADESNSGPFVRRMSPLVTPKDTPAVFGLEVVDMEFDYLDIQHSMLPLSASLGPRGTLLTQSGRVVQMQPNLGYTGGANIGFSIRSFNVGAGGFNAINDYTNAFIGCGDFAARPEPVTLEVQPGVAVANVVTAKLQDLDAAGAPGNFTARINWGDGTPISTATVARDTSTAESNLYIALGGHTYAQAGVYPLVVEFFGSNGARTSVRSTAVVSSAPLRASGEKFALTNGRVVNRILATFTDSAAANPSDYTAKIQWGDGGNSTGTISRNNDGRFIVRGTHGYLDSQAYSVAVHIHRTGTPASSDALAWTSIEPTFKSPQHLPPFAHPKLTIAWNSGPTKTHTGTPGPNYQVTYTGTFVIINTGNKDLGVSKLRFWLSNDRTLNKTAPGIDFRVPVNGSKELNIIPFPAGAGGSGQFTIKMPKGESTGRKFLLAEADYSDPIADADGTDKVIATGPLPPTALINAAANLQTTEAGGTATFTVTLDTPPSTPTVNISSITAGNPVNINTATPHGFTSGQEILISGASGSSQPYYGVFVATVVDSDTISVPVNATTGGSGGTVQLNPKVTFPLESSLVTEGTVSPAQLVFDSTNWNIPQTVTVTGVNDTADDGDKNYKITIKTGVSSDVLYNGLSPGEVPLKNLDDDPAAP